MYRKDNMDGGAWATSALRTVALGRVYSEGSIEEGGTWTSVR